MSGLIPSREVAGNGDTAQSSYYILKGDLIVVNDLMANEVMANTITSGVVDVNTNIDLNGGILTVSGSDLLLNGIAIGGGSASLWATFPATQNVDLSGFKITDLGTPTDASDCATKAYVDSVAAADAALWSTYPPLQSIDMSGFRIRNTNPPTDISDAATKGYVDSQGFITSPFEWSLFPAIATVDICNQPIENVSFISPGLTNTVSIIHDDPGSAPILEVEKVDDGANGPIMSIYHNSSTPAVNDKVGTILLQGNNSSSAKETFGGIEVVAQNITAGAEDGMVNFQVANNSGLATYIQLDGSSNTILMQREVDVRNLDILNAREIIAQDVGGANTTGLTITAPKSLSASTPALVVSAGADRIDISSSGVNMTLTKQITNNAVETIGQLNFQGDDSTGTSYQAGFLGLRSDKNTAGSQDASMYHRVRVNGTNTDFLTLDGSNNYIDAHTHRIVNVVDPVDPQDAVTLNYINNTLSIPLDVVLTFGNNAGANDIDMSNNDILQVSNLTNAAGELNISADDLNLSATGLLSVLNIGAVAGITLTSAGAAAINAVGAVQIGTAGLISIGSSADSTEIEEVKFSGNEISKVAGEPDISMGNVGSIRNTSANIITLSGDTTTITSQNAGRLAPTLELVSVSGGAAGTYLQFYHNSASPAANDRVGVLDFYGNSSTGVKREFARMRTMVYDTTNTTEDGGIELWATKAGTITQYMDIDGSNNGIIINPNKNITGGTSLFKIFDSQGVTTNNTLMYADVSSADLMFKNYPQRYIYDISGDYTLTFPDPGWNTIRVLMAGGGGGGGSGRLDGSGSCFGGGAGSGGNCVECWYDRRELFPDVSGEITLSIRVGGGGDGGAAQTVDKQNGNNGVAGQQTTVSIGSTINTSVSLYYQVLGGNAGSGGTNAAGTGGAAPTFGGGNFGFAGRPGASSSITAQPSANTTGSSNYAGTICQPPGGSGAGGGVNAGATTAYNGGSMASPAGQYYGVPAGAGLGLQTLSVGTAGTVGAAATGGAGFTFAAPISNAAVRPLRGNVDGFSGGGGSVNATTGGGAGGGHTAGTTGSRGSGGGGGGGAIAVASGAGGRGRDGLVYITVW